MGGEHEGWAEPNGLLPNAGSLIRVPDSNRWLKAEERTAELIAYIQPNQPSEYRRKAVADYVERLITKCFPCQVFKFGSVPLKTYLPDGDIDLTAFSDNQNLKDTWANQVRDMLENEEKNENAEFLVKEVQYIQAEVKIIKCLVENIVVDISFNQLGGLCTLCFLEEVDNLINQDHLFKRSIILIKAWCYYESRILGAHHGLISTYALETLVLYIFHVFNNSFAGPLEVLHRFLEFFSNFDWDNFCVSLWGPVPISSLPDVIAEPPRKDCGELLLSKLFLNACSSVYAVYPVGQENHGQPFVSKHFNVIDPLRVNNNLGRSVSKGNFFRVRSAFAFGAKRLARLLDCTSEDLDFEVNQFFMNTWDRHGSGLRPDAPRTDLRHLRSSTPDQLLVPENHKNNLRGKKMNDNSYGHENEIGGTRPRGVSSQNSSTSESISRTNDISAPSRTQSQKNYSNMNNSRVSDQIVRGFNSNQIAQSDIGRLNLKPDPVVNDIQGRCFFARTRSSPELTDTYGDVSFHGMHNKPPQSGKSQATSARLDGGRRKNLRSEISASHSGQSCSDDPSSVRQVPSRQSVDANADADADMNSSSNSYLRDSGFGAMSEEMSSTFGTQGMHQEDQDLVNMMASSATHSFNGQDVPLNLTSAHLPFPISPSILASMGYAQGNMAGMVPTNFPLIDPSFSHIQFPHGSVSMPLAHYFPGIELASNSEDSIEPCTEDFGSALVNSGEADDIWTEQDLDSTGGCDPDNGNCEMLPTNDKPPSTEAGFDFAPPSQMSGSGSSMRVQQKYTKEQQASTREDCLDNCLYQDKRGYEVYSDERTTSSRFSSAAHSGSLRSKTSSESSWVRSSAKVSKSTREKMGKKMVPSEPSAEYGKGKVMSELVSTQSKEDDQEWNPLSNTGTEMAERNSGHLSAASLHPMHHIPGYESQTSRQDSMAHIAPMLLGPGSRQRMMDNSGLVAFYPTGPPVPFLTMLPVYNMPPETGTSDASTSNFGGEEGVDNGDSFQNFADGLDQSEELNTSNSVGGVASTETSDEHKSDILNSDFASHWQNLQYGRFCQNPRPHGPLVYPSPVMVPPTYLQGRFPWDGPGRPVSANMNLFTQLMSYGPHLVPVAPLQSVSHRPPNVYQRYDDMPRYRSGTGTYLPNPRVSARDRHSSGTRRGNYNYDRSDNHNDRDANWNSYSKSRAAGRSHRRSQTEKSSSRLDRLPASEARADGSWSSYRHDFFPSYQAQNGPLRSKSGQSSGPSGLYGMQTLPALDANGESSNGPDVSYLVMQYPFDHNAGYGLHAEQLEFGSLGPVGFSDMNDQSPLSEGSRVVGPFDEHRFHGALCHGLHQISHLHPIMIGGFDYVGTQWSN
ncbi:unnamed protein product [Ilex paraguariensis]|uniref:Polymerase nucleotidyl transferase domain-containing protein n=1 Tax=Ilex paraguariensis TaxID=185542 RepID=A0ABC8T8R9_9AQUA